MPLSLLNNPGRARRKRGFTLIEILAAVAVLSIILLVLVNLSSQAGKIWSQSERQNQYRQKARASLEFIGCELKRAVLALDRNQTSLQFVINPPAVTQFSNRDVVFWQAPVGTDPKGSLAEIGYFVRWENSQANLCRFFVNPSDTNYKVYTAPLQWVTDDLLNSVAPGDNLSNHHYRGLFLENVLGIWVNAYQADGTPYNGDSRSVKKLPATVEISLVFLDATSARRLEESGLVNGIKNGYTAADADAFVAALPGLIRNEAGVANVKVSLDNYR